MKISIVSERVANSIKLNNIYRIKTIQVYTPTSAYDDEVKRFYEDVEAAMELHTIQYSFIISDFNAKVGKRSVGIAALRYFGVDSQNDKGDILIGFSERDNLKIMNTFFDCKASKKWTWKSLNSETKIKSTLFLLIN